MKVKLLKNVIEAGTLKTARRNNKNWHPPVKQADGSFKESTEDQFNFIPFVAGAVIEMSEASAEKYIENGLAEPHNEENEDGERNPEKPHPAPKRNRKAKSRHAAKDGGKRS